MRAIVHNVKPKKESPRQLLGKVASNGDMRYWLRDRLDDETLTLLMDIVIRYCEPRPRKRLK